MNEEKKHKWLFRIIIVLIKAYKKDRKLKVSEIRAELDNTGFYDDLPFEQKEARIWKSLEWLSKHKKLSDVKDVAILFDSNDEDGLEAIFNKETANLKVVRFGKLWGLE